LAGRQSAARRAKALLAGGALAIGLAAATAAPGGAFVALRGVPAGESRVVVDEDRSANTAQAEIALTMRKQGGQQQEY
jgi:hypothetical protein